MEKRSEVEINTYQQRVNRLQAELDRSTADMKKHLAEYKNLMNVKQSLEKVRKTAIFSCLVSFRKSILTEIFWKAKKDDSLLLALEQ